MDWKGAMRDAAKQVGKGLVAGTRAIAKDMQRGARNTSRKEAILNRMSDRQVRSMARNFGVRPSLSAYDDEPDGDDYRRAIVNDVRFVDVLAYAKKHGVQVADIERRIAEEHDNEVRERFDQLSPLRGLVGEIADVISTFKPQRRYGQEFPYQIELAGFLQGRFPNARIEERRGSTRPDIVVGGVAIEVKGPTHERDLVTIADKALRYRQHFPGGLVVVLFSVDVHEGRYSEWEVGLRSVFPELVVIRR